MNVNVSTVPIPVEVKPKHTWTVTIDDLTDRDVQILRRIFGANLTVPSYFDNTWRKFYEDNEIYKFMQKIANGLDSGGVTR